MRVWVWWRVRVRLWRGVWGGMLLRWCRGRDGKDVQGGKEGADGSVPGGKPARDVPEVSGHQPDRPGAPLQAYSDGVVGSEQHRPDTPPPAYSDTVVGSEQRQPGALLPAHSDGVVGSGQHRPGAPLPAHSAEVVGSEQDRPSTPPPPYSAVAGGDQVPGAHGVDVPGNRSLGVHASQTPDSPAVTPGKEGAVGSVPGGKSARGVPEVPGSGPDRPGAPLPAYSDGVVGSGQERPGNFASQQLRRVTATRTSRSHDDYPEPQMLTRKGSVGLLVRAEHRTPPRRSRTRGHWAVLRRRRAA